MLPPSLGARTSPRAALLLALTTFIASAACGQEGIVQTGGSAPTGGNGGTGGTTDTAGGGGGGGSTGVGGAETPQPLKLLNWNLHNFFDKKKDSDVQEEFVLTANQYSDKLAGVGAILKELTPDVACLPEIENQAILDELNTKQLGGAYTTGITQTNDFRGLDIGVLSKVPIVDLISHKDDSFKRLDLAGGPSYKYSRDAVEIHLNYNTRKVVLLCVHYRSKGTGTAETDDKDKRMAEAQHTRYLADQIAAASPKAAILIMGDFNDLPGSPPVTWTLQGDPENTPKIPFFASADAIAADNRYTFVYEGTKELIDHQMTNSILGEMLDPTSVVIRHGADAEDASDHYALMATYQVK